MLICVLEDSWMASKVGELSSFLSHFNEYITVHPNYSQNILVALNSDSRHFQDLQCCTVLFCTALEGFTRSESINRCLRQPLKAPE